MSIRQPGQPGGEAGVLALLADGQRELVVAHHDGGRPGLLVEAHLAHSGGRQRGLDQVDRVVGERHHVDALAAQLVGDHAHPGAPRADAGADGVDVGVVRPHGDLGAVAGLARGRLDLDDARRDLGDLELEEPLDEPGVACG